MLKVKPEQLEKIIEVFKTRTEKECYKIEMVDGNIEILDDKLGGYPYLPVGEEYPLDKKGNPLRLLLQVNLKNVDLPNFPKEGVLEVFTNADWPCDYVIKLYKEGLEYQTEFPKFVSYDEDFDYFVEKPSKIKLSKNITHMPMSEYRFDNTLFKIINEQLGVNIENFSQATDILGDDEFWDIREKVVDACSHFKATLGGYASFAQEDPRYDHLPNQKSECIFKIDCVGLEDYIIIGDSGIIFGLITEEDLKNANFNNALVDWDCC